MRVVLILLALLWAAPAQAANYCVKTTGTDATVKASIVYVAGDEAGSTCWQTIGRAAWGDETRSTPDTSQAITAGDTVYVFGGTYIDNSVDGTDEFNTWYRPINTGTGDAVASRIRFICVGDCRLEAPNLEGPIAGSSNLSVTNNYITWYANISLGHSWEIDSCPDTAASCPSTSVQIRQDTGPVICKGTGIHLEGFVITSVTEAPNDNYNGIKGHGCIDGLIQNNSITGFHITSHSDQGHASCFQFYQTNTTIVQHNYCGDSNAGIILKDNDAVGNTGGGNTFRLNYFDDMSAAGFTISHITAGETASIFSQNIVDGNVRTCINIISAPSGDDFINNVCYNGQAFSPGLISIGGASTAGMRIWNNIGHTLPYMAAVEVGGMYAPAVADHEHNAYYNFFEAFFIDESAGTDNFAQWLAGTTGQDEDAPASTSTSDPRFANIAGDDFRLCTAAGVPDASCVGASPAIALGVDALDLDSDSSTTDTIPAGAYVTGNEIIGLDVTPSVADPPRMRLKIRKEEIAALLLVPLVWRRRRHGGRTA